MKKIFILVAVTLLAVIDLKAQMCDVRVGIGPIEAGDVVAPGIERQLEIKLKKALAKNGIVADGAYSNFYLTGRFDSSYTDMLNRGSSQLYTVKTTLTIYIADINGQVFGAKSFELKGVGDSEERAYQKCLNSLNPNTASFVDFVDGAKQKIIEYFNNNYNTYLTRANAAIGQRKYDEAMYYAGMIPECCVGFNQAQSVILQAYKDYTNYDSNMLLQKAQQAWGANPTEAGAYEALGYLAAIDPSAACYPAAQELTKTITRQVRSDIDYETRTKYENQVSLEKARINAARDIGVAWAKNQPKVVYNNRTIVHRHYW